jgi:hypothetical protein
MGKFSVDVTSTLVKSFWQDEEHVSIYSGVVGIFPKGVSFFIFTVKENTSFFRIGLQLKSDESSKFETVNHNTSGRLYRIPNPNHRFRSSTNSDDDENYNFHIDQLHISKKFQRQGCGSKLMALILFWMRITRPDVRKCLVISPSSIGIPFYLSDGASHDLSSSNLVIKLSENPS